MSETIIRFIDAEMLNEGIHNECLSICAKFTVYMCTTLNIIFS